VRAREDETVRDLVAFLRARLDEDERHVDAMDDFWLDTNDEFTGDAVRRFTDEKRVLADIDAKRRILEQCEHTLSYRPPVPRGKAGEWALASATVMLLALPFADHPDYRDEWRL